MPSSIERKIQYIFQLSTNIKEATDSAASALDSTQDKIDGVQTSAGSLSGTLTAVTAETQRFDTAVQSASSSARTMASEASTATEGASKARTESEATEDSVINLRREMSQTTTQASQYTKTLSSVRSATEETLSKVDESFVQVDQKQLGIVTQLTTIMGMREGVSALTSGLIGLGIATGDTAEALNQVNSAFSLMSGAVSIIKSVQAVMTTLNISTASFASITTFLNVLKNPMYLGVAAAGLGVMGATYLALSSNNGTDSGTIGAGGTSASSVTNNTTTTYNITGSGAETIAEELGAVTRGALR